MTDWWYEELLEDKYQAVRARIMELEMELEQAKAQVVKQS